MAIAGKENFDTLQAELNDRGSPVPDNMALRLIGSLADDLSEKKCRPCERRKKHLFWSVSHARRLLATG
jgi:hypothetical protein